MKKKKSKAPFVYAKLSNCFAEIARISIWNLIASFLLFLIMSLGTSAIPYVFKINISFGEETALLRGLIFLPIMIACLVILCITGIGSAVLFKVTEVMCLRMDEELKGAADVTEEAGKADLQYHLAKAAGVPLVNTKVSSGMSNVLETYLQKNNQKTVNHRLFRWINIICIVLQAALAIVCLYLLLK